ncbi:hypothetical protein AXA44_01110 [Rhodococcus sp. SC4]|nr:hypothetical protein AXA44_01110 [Rhodococcus sp. SC4]
MKNPPPYPLSSVDNALLLLHILRDQGRLTVSEAAELLGIGRSTAHRLLAMLVYRDFAVQDDAREYRPGPSLVMSAVGHQGTGELNMLLRPLMTSLRDRFKETVHLVVRNGRWVRFIASVECDQYLRVGDRRGTTMPARTTSGGKALLAELSDEQLSRLYHVKDESGGASLDSEHDLPQDKWDAMMQSLGTIRRRGFALNVGESEVGLTAVGVVLRNVREVPVAALSVAAPTARLGRRNAERIGIELCAIARTHRVNEATGVLEPLARAGGPEELPGSA